MGIILYVLAVLAILFSLPGFYILCHYWLYAVPMAKYYKKRKQELINHPKIIVVGSGPPKRSAVDILTNPGPMPEWKPVPKDDK